MTGIFEELNELKNHAEQSKKGRIPINQAMSFSEIEKKSSALITES